MVRGCKRDGVMCRYRRQRECVYWDVEGKTKLGQLSQEERDRLVAGKMECPFYRAGERVVRPRRLRYSREKIRRLYDQGASDVEIAKALGCSVYPVEVWRKEFGLPPNGRKGAAPKLDKEQMRALYMLGLNDREIGDRLGCSSSTVKKWRWNNKLPATRRPSVCPARGADGRFLKGVKSNG